jgi:hypothetical protein
MSDLLSNILVILAVAASALYALWRLGPQALRKWLRAQYCRLLSIEDRSQAPSSACDTCGACGPRPAHRRSKHARTP